MIFTGVRGYLDKVDVNQVTRFEEQYLSEIRNKGGEILKSIRESSELSEETEKKLVKFCEDFVKTFA